METGLNRNTIIAELSRSTHGDLKDYMPLGRQAANEQPEFFAHLIAWNQLKGQVRDSKVALPLIGLTSQKYAPEFIENSFAHLTLLNPRELLKAFHFMLDEKIPLRTTAKKIMRTSLLQRERNWPKWERTMLQHRSVLRTLFSLLHLNPEDPRTRACLFGAINVDGKKVRVPYPEGGLFELVSHLKNMPPLEAAGSIMQKKIPFLIALGALGDKAKTPDLVLALIKSMTATELVTNTKMLEDLGVKTDPALRGAFQEALAKASTSTANVLKTTRAIENIEDEELQDNLRGLQKKQIAKLGGVDGDWLVLGDRSPSMEKSVELAKEIAATLTGMVKGKVTLTYFDSYPQSFDVTGLALDEIKKKTKHVSAGGGGTSIGCGLQKLMDEKTIVDAIAIISDGGENTSPLFHSVYARYAQFADKEVPVYLYLVPGDNPNLVQSMKLAGIDMQVFDLRGQKPDFYSLPNLVSTMRTNRYSLSDEILSTRLLKLDDAYKDAAKTVTA